MKQPPEAGLGSALGEAGACGSFLSPPATPSNFGYEAPPRTAAGPLGTSDPQPTSVRPPGQGRGSRVLAEARGSTSSNLQSELIESGRHGRAGDQLVLGDLQAALELAGPVGPNQPIGCLHLPSWKPGCSRFAHGTSRHG